MTQRTGHEYARDEDYPDHSVFLWHLTSDKKAHERCFPTLPNVPDSAEERFRLIIEQKLLRASYTQFTDLAFSNLTNRPIAVCFTECIPASFALHALRYSNYGFLFRKKYIFSKGGRPALYVDIELFNRLHKNRYPPPKDPFIDFPENELFRFTPFVPPYGKDEMGGKKYDFMVEREWRIGENLHFDYPDVYAYLVPNESKWHEIVSRFPSLKDRDFVPLDEIKKKKFDLTVWDNWIRNLQTS